MILRSFVRLTSVLAVLLGLAVASPAWAHDRRDDYYPRDYNRGYGQGYGYGGQYDHYQRDRHRAYDHYGRDRRESFGHALGDLFRYGTTNPYSSPEHYYRDRQRAYRHAQRDRWDEQRHRSYDFYRYGDRYGDW